MSNTTEKFSQYDSADYLVDIEDAAAYLEAALEEAGDGHHRAGTRRHRSLG